MWPWAHVPMFFVIFQGFLLFAMYWYVLIAPTISPGKTKSINAHYLSWSIWMDRWMNVGLPPSGLGWHPELLIDGVTPANETSLDTSSVREHSQVGDAKNWCYFTRVLKVLFYAFYCFAIYNASYIYTLIMCFWKPHLSECCFVVTLKIKFKAIILWLTVHSHGASALMLLIYFEWVTSRVAELWITARIRSWTFLNFSRASANQIALCK